MKRSWTKYIIGYFFIIAFLFNGIVPEVMILSGQLSHTIMSETLAEQEDVNTERNTEETQGEQRTEYLPVAHTSYYIHPAPNFFVSDKVIPTDIAFISTVVMPVPTPPPDVTII